MKRQHEYGRKIQSYTVEIGGTDLPPAGGAGGSASAASICVAVTTACREIRTRLVTAAVGTAGSPFRGADPATLTLEDGALRGPGSTREPLPAAIQRAPSGVGASAALHEATEIDERTARYTNADLAAYLIPVNADIIDVETIMVPEQDSLVNELGVKGLGELGIVGLNAAVANAVYHATGTRVRELPIRLENLIPARAAARS